MPQSDGFTLGKCVVILSGGLDSSTLAYYLVDRGWEPHALTFRYGQKHEKEIQYATKIVQNLGIPHYIVNLDSLQPLLNNSSLIQGSNEAIPRLESPKQRTLAVLEKTVVPFRNGIFLAIATGYASNIGAGSIFYGAHFSDYAVYPDCRPEFVHLMEKAIQAGTDSEILLKAPFVHMSKAQVLNVGAQLSVPFADTWSCYKGEKIHCGVCPSCIERKKAFLEGRLDDPTEYARRL
jgi:7-cyano-7-deazaguanine synthase